MVMMVNGYFRETTYLNSWNMLLVVGSKVSQWSTTRVVGFFVATNEKSPFYDEMKKEVAQLLL
jgi:hypothetical protein